MQCHWCRRNIGFFRRLIDREYCSSIHRKLGKAGSARALRDIGYTPGDLDEFSLRPTETKRGRTTTKTSFAGFAMLFGLFVLVMLWLPHSDSAGGGGFRASGGVPASTGLFSSLGSRLPAISLTSVKFTENFQSGLKDWSRPRGGGSEWTVRGGAVQPRELRLWAPSLKLRDYEFQFKAQIENKAIGWAYRASDVNNYYATKITVSRPDAEPVSEIVRYAVIRGQQRDRIQLPLPVKLEPGSTYRVRVSVKGEQFVTSVNGSVVDRWTDARLRSGGVGFFADGDENGAVMGVEVSERRGLLDRIFLPALLAPPAWAAR